MTGALRAQGTCISRKRVVRLMAEENLCHRLKRRFVRPKESAREEAVATNVLDRQFAPGEPNKVWASDITYVRTRRGWAYLAVVLDLGSRKVVQLNLRLRRVSPRVQTADAVMSVQFHPDITVFAADGTPQGTIWQLGSCLIQLPAVGHALLELAHNHPQRDEMHWFEFNLPLNEVPVNHLYLRVEVGEANELQHMVAVNVQGEFEFGQQRVDLDISRFEERLFGHGEAIIGGVRHVIVATVDESMTVANAHVEPDKARPTKKRLARKAPRTR